MRARAGHIGRWVAFALAVVMQLIVLYAPAAPPTPSALPRVDLLVHLLVFAAVAVSALRLGVRVSVVVGILVVHALVSELLQANLLADRSGDPWDVAANMLGVVGGTAAVVVMRRGRDR